MGQSLFDSMDPNDMDANELYRSDSTDSMSTDDTDTEGGYPEGASPRRNSQLWVGDEMLHGSGLWDDDGTFDDDAEIDLDGFESDGMSSGYGSDGWSETTFGSDSTSVGGSSSCSGDSSGDEHVLAAEMVSGEWKYTPVDFSKPAPVKRKPTSDVPAVVVARSVGSTVSSVDLTEAKAPPTAPMPVEMAKNGLYMARQAWTTHCLACDRAV
jgi:hypothetical protein